MRASNSAKAAARTSRRGRAGEYCRLSGNVSSKNSDLSSGKNSRDLVTMMSASASHNSPPGNRRKTGRGRGGRGGGGRRNMISVVNVSVPSSASSKATSSSAIKTSSSSNKRTPTRAKKKRTTAPSSSRRRSSRLNTSSKGRQTPSKAILVKSLKAAREGKKRVSVCRNGTTPLPTERGGVFSNESNLSSSPLPTSPFSSSKVKTVGEQEEVEEDFCRDELRLSSSSSTTSPSSPSPSSSLRSSSSSSSSSSSGRLLSLPLVDSESVNNDLRTKSLESRSTTACSHSCTSSRSLREASCNSNEVVVVGIDSSSMEVDQENEEDEEGKNVMEDEEEEKEEGRHERKGEKTGLFTWLRKLWRK
ncbi:hypothetical protein CSUI_006718 [Cystoisospora suis]|uniref:Uncharacterized protein n=1 Tax=Cystoisospora suis TaxID=483139 RepID=A0A2C6KTI9_9APIC|nr:hypothetical protein CSUI_006718 [Cystoisospora suis]